MFIFIYRETNFTWKIFGNCYFENCISVAILSLANSSMNVCGIGWLEFSNDCAIFVR